MNPTNWLLLSNLGILLFTSLYMASFYKMKAVASTKSPSKSSKTISWSW